MARKNPALIVQTEANDAVEAAAKDVEKKRCALTRANDELSQAEGLLKLEERAIRGVLPEDYPESYEQALERRDVKFAKMTEADDAYWEAREQLDAARLAAAEAAALASQRRYVSLGTTFAPA